MRGRICHLCQPRPRGSDRRQRPQPVVRLRQSEEGRRPQRRTDRRIARPQASSEGGVKLVAIAADDDVAGLAERLAPGFGGDAGPARELLAQTLDLLTRDPRPPPWGSYLALE